MDVCETSYNNNNESLCSILYFVVLFSCMMMSILISANSIAVKEIPAVLVSGDHTIPYLQTK